MEWIYKYISLTAVIAALWFLVRYLIQKKIDSYFNKRLETYKQELTIITENAKYDISKKLYDFEAYASKKHVVYPELYSLAFEPWRELSGFRYGFDRDIKHSKKDMDEKELDICFHEALMPITDKISVAYSYFYKNELYLSRSAAIVFEDAMFAQIIFASKIMDSFERNITGDWRDSSFLLIDIDNEDYERAEKKFVILKEVVYRELSYTHSENTE